MLTASKFTALRVEQHGPVLEITLSRPDLLNRFDQVLHDEFVELLEALRKASGISSVVLASEGRVFSAGGDFEFIRAANANPAQRRVTAEGARRLIYALTDLPQPVVVAVQGAAIGLGATVALACDAVVAARPAIIADSHVNIGLVAGDGGCLVWPASAGMPRARRHLLTGDPIDAQTAFTLGMVTDLVEEPAEALPAARRIAEHIAALPPMAVQGTKRALNRVTQQRAGEVIDLSVACEEATLGSVDVLEGIAAFEEKRPGNYVGH